MPVKQEDIFLREEGDKWFLRNKDGLISFQGDPSTEYLATLPLVGKRLLDVGCSMGQKVAPLTEKGVECWGVEPSHAAVEEGQKRFPKMHISQGTADVLDFEDDFFDIVFISFVLHWVGRSKLLKAVSEIDRVLKDGGTLVISDFFPDIPHRRTYHHNTELGVYTYKQDYSKIFTASNLYTENKRMPFMHIGPKRELTGFKLGDDSGMLISLTKGLTCNYPTRESA